MSGHEQNREVGAQQDARFCTTQWSMVVAAGQRPSLQSRNALESLCRTYWYPLYAFVRRKGHTPTDAQDLTQEFFARLLEKNVVAAADPLKGRFRSFLLASLNQFLSKEWRRNAAQKRGGGRALLSLDFESGENRFTIEPSYDLTPERIFERRWALTLLEQTFTKLREEFAHGEKSHLFELLTPYVGGGDELTVPYRELAAELGMSEGAIKVTVHRLRRRCREFLRAEIAQTVAQPEEINEELHDLFDAFSR